MKSFLVCLLTVNWLLICQISPSAAQSPDPYSARLNALEVMIAEEKQLRMQLESQVDGSMSRLSEFESYQEECGCAGKPTGNPAFMAALSADLEHCSRYQPIIFDAVKLNQGGGYDDRHGIFKAPISGIYMFTSTLSVQPQASYHTAFVKNNATNEIGYLYTDPISIWLERSTSVLTHLNVNEEVWMVCLSDSRIEGDHNHNWEGAADFHSHMAGFLISADEYSDPTEIIG